MNTNIKAFLAPLLTVVFVAGGGWVTLDAVAKQNEDLAVRVTEVEKKASQQQLVDLKIDGIEKRLDKMEVLQQQMMALQQQQAINQSAICQATSANCR